MAEGLDAMLSGDPEEELQTDDERWAVSIMASDINGYAIRIDGRNILGLDTVFARLRHASAELEEQGAKPRAQDMPAKAGPVAVAAPMAGGNNNNNRVAFAPGGGPQANGDRYYCVDCGAEIEGFTNRQTGKTMSNQQMAQSRINNFGHQICTPCSKSGKYVDRRQQRSA